MKRKKQLTLWRLGIIGLLMVVFFGLIQQKINLIQAISYDDSSNVWCDSDLKITLNDASSGFLSELGSWATYVLTAPWTVGNNTNENAVICSSKVATVSYSEWSAVKSTYRTALNGSDSGNYFVSGVTNAWTRTPSATAGYAYQMAASGGALSTATVATNNSILPGLYLDTTQVCLTDFTGGNGLSSNPYPVVVGSNCDFAPTITIDDPTTAIFINTDSSSGMTISGTATDYDGGQTITISATIAGTTKSTAINILATATVNWSLTWSLAELTNGIYTGNKVFTVTDSAGKTGTANYTGTITVDKTAPSVMATSPTYPEDATLTLTDNLGVTHWAVTTSSTAPSTTAAGTNVTNITSTGLGSWQPITQSTSTSATFTPAATGTYYAWVKDVSGNTASVTFTVTNGIFSGSATITGTLYVSESLTSNNTISPTGTYTYQWYRNSTSSTSGATAIAGATSSNYTLTASDASKYVYVVISATKTYYTTKTFTSNILGPINGLPTLVLTPSSGYTRSGSTTTSTISGTNYGTLSCASSNTAAATCSISGTTLTITGGSTSATATITVTEANMSVQATYTVINDVVAPTGMAVSCPGTYSSTGNYVVTQTGTITDSGGSGVNNSTKFFQVKSGALSNGVCNFGAATFVDTGDAGSNSLTQNPMPAGCYVYRYRTSDNSGNTGYSSTCQIMVGEPPTCSIALSGTQGSNSWYTGTLTGTLTTSSPYFGLSYYDIATSYISSSTNTKTTTTNAADGTNLYFYGYSQDTVGQISRCTSIAYKKDGTVPTASATTATYGGTSTLTLADATSGVSYWAVTTSGTAPSTTAAGTNVTSITSTGLNTWQPISNGTSKTATFTNNGAGTYYAWAKDDAGNVSAAGSFTVTKDSFTPVVSMTGYTYGGTKNEPSISGNTSGGEVTYYYNTTNSNSGGTLWSTITSSTSLSAGTYYMYAVVAETANYSAATSATTSFVIAKANPTLTLSATSGYVGVGKTATFTETGSVAGNFGNVSGTTSVATVSPASYTGIAASTAKTVTITGVAAGASTITVTFTPTDTTNYNTRTATYAVTTTSIALTPTSGFAGVGASKTKTATISGSNYGTATCGTSNAAIATCSISGTTLTMTGVAEGLATITVTGSNGGPTATFALTVDNTNPTCGTWTPATAPWTTSANQSFTLASSTDGGSGIQTAGGSCSVSTNGGTCTVTITDNVNNTTVCTSPTAKIDTGLPSISTTVTPSATWTNSCTASVVTIGDTVSGLPASQSVYYAWSTSAAVAPTFSSNLTFSGTAGRTANESRTVANPAAAGTYYLWVKSGVTDVAGNVTSSNYVNTGTTCQYDPTAPTISLSPSSNATCTTNQSVTVTVADTGGAGLKASQTVKYGWSTSTSVEPASYTDVTLSNSAGATSTTFTATGTGTSGNYYLWVVPVALQDQANNSAVAVKSGAFCFDNSAPTITLSANSDTTYAQTKSVTVTVADSTGLAAGQTLKYGWSTSSSTEPTAYTNVTLSNSAGATSTTFNATGSGLTGSYYLWVVPLTLQDTLGTAQTTTTKSTGTFKFDNSAPVCLSPGTASGATTSTSIFNLTNSSGADLASYKIYGNSIQNGTPSPNAPVEVVSLGETGSILTTSRTENLIDNGNGSTGDNTNFTNWTYASDTFSPTGSKFSISSSALISPMSNNYVAVDPNQTYTLSMYAKDNGMGAHYYVGFREYDIDKLGIGAANVMYVNNTLTSLTQDLNPGDTVVHLADLTNFLDTSNTPTYQLGLIFWNYQDSTGYLYPPSTYSRNVYPDLFTYNQIDKITKTITLKTAWTRAAVPAGTQLSQSNSGSAFNYSLMSNALMSTSWQKYSAVISGISTTYYTDVPHFRAGTKYIRFAALNNYPPAVANNVTDYTDIYFAQSAPEKTATFDFSGKEPLHKVGDTADYIDFANQKIVRNVGKYVVSGNENWGEHSSIAGLFILGGEVVSNVYPDNDNIISSCSHFQAYSYSNTIGSINFGQSMGGVTYGTNRIFLRDTDYSGNLSSFKSWLVAQATAGTPVTVYYQLATPTYEPLSANIGTVMGDGTLMISDGNMIPSSSEISYYQTGSIPSWSPSAPVPWKVAAATQDFTLTGATDVGGAGMSASSYACTAGATNGATCLTTIADNAGNTNICMSPMNRIDLDNPNCVITGNPSDWTNQNVTLSLASSNDVTSGLAAAPYSWTAYNAGYSTTATTTITNNGTYNAWVKDDAGRWSTCSVDVTKIDKVAPSCSISLAGTVGDNSWYKGAVTGTLSYTDDSGSIRYYDIATSSITTSTNTVSTKANSTNGSSLQFYGFVQDTAGNTATCTSSTYKLDLTKPTVSATSVTYGSQSVLTVQDNLAGVVGWQVTSSATEPTSGWTTITNTGTTATQVTDATTRDAGTYYAWAKDAAGNVSVAGSFSVTKATPIVSLTAKSATYTGSAIVANTATVTPATGGAVTYLYYTNNTCATQTTTADGSGAAATGAAPVNVGSYYVKATVAATTNYNSASSACTAHTITAASFTPVVSMTGYTYGGTKNEPSISGNTSGGEVTYYYNTTNSNSGGTLWSTITSSTSLSAGTYYMYAVVAETANYSAATSATTSFVIAKATPIVSLTARSATYNGLAIVANTATVTPATGGAVTYLYYTDNTCATQTTTADGSGAAAIGAAPVNVGSYYVKATVAATTNYNSASSSCTTHTIVSAATAATGSCASLTYNGAAQTLASGASNAVYSNNTGVNAGSYTVTITANTNYTFSDGTSSKTLSCNIGTKSIAVVWGETTSFIYNGAEQGPTASATSGVTGETLNISRTTATNVGSYTSTATLNSVTGGQALTTNYTLTGNTKAFTITKLAPTLNIEITGTPITGNTLTANVTTNSDGAKTYQWWTATTAGATSGTIIDGATGNTFVVTNAQAGLYVGVTVTVAETANYASINGTAITASKAQGVFTGSVTITGTVTYGETLTVNTTGITPTGTYTYQWYSNTTESTTGGVAISGATSGTYVIGSGLVGKYIYVVVTASATDYVSQNFAAVTTPTVTKGTPTISLIAKTATYNGLGIAANNATATYKGDSVSLSYNYVYYSGDSCQGEALGSVPVNAGVYSVIATANATSDLNSASSSCTTHTIVSAATATTGSCASLTYNGAAQTLASGASNAVYSNNTGVNAGSYTVTITANTNYTFSDGTSSKTLSCNIGTKSIAVVWGETTSFIYNGAEQGPTASATSGVTGETLNISRTTATNVGSYTSTATLNSVTGGQALTSNYTLTGNTKAFTITPAETTVSLVAKTATYTGSAIVANTATVIPTMDGTFTYVYYTNNTCGTQTTTSDGSGAATIGAAPKNVGEYYVKATFTPTSENYASSSSVCTAHTITTALTATTGSCASLTYNSMLQTLASGGARVTYANNSAVNAGSYTVTVTANANYAFADGTTSKTLNCSIAKKTATVTAASVSREYNGMPLTSNNCTFAGGIGGQIATCVMTSASTITEVGVANNVIETVTIKDNNEAETTDNYTLTKVNGTLTIIDSEIVITDQPNNLSVNEGTSGSFSVTATGSNLTYQWYVNNSNSTTGGTAISGATAATYTITAENMTGALNGKYYYVILVNSGYTQTSTAALLTVYGIPAPAPTLTASDGIASGNWHKEDFTLGISGSAITGAGAVGYLYGTTTAPTIEGNLITVNTETAATSYYAQAYNTLATSLKSEISTAYIAKLDKTAPTGAGVTCPAGYSTTGNYTVTGTTGTDTGGSGIATSLSYFQVRTGALIDGVCNYGSNDFGNTGSAGSESLIQNPMPSGCYTYRYIISDNAGNTNTSATCQVLVDINVPSAPSVTITDDEGNELGSIDGGETAGSCNTTGITIYSASASANLNFSGSSDAETGIAGYAYATSAGGTKIEATSLVATATTTGTTYFIYAKDVAGNYSTCYTKVTVKLVTLVVTPNSGISYVEGENLTATISGNNYGTLSCQSSDASKATCLIEGTTLTVTPVAEGTATITVTETNTNASTIYTATIWDQPSCTISENPTSWAQSAVLTVSSNNSNLASAPFSWETATTGFSQTTTKNIIANDTYTAWVKNDLGLTGSCQITVTNIDTVMPVVLATDDTIYTNQTPITTRIYNVSDVDSGIGSVTWNLWAGSTKLVDGVTGGNTGTTYYKNFDFSSLDEGYYTVTGTVTDVAGNAYDWDDDFGAIGIYYDTTPAVGGGVTIETENINLNTNSIDLTVADGTDNLSGLNLSTRILTTRTGVLANGECGEYGAWTNQSYSGAYPNLTVTTNYVGDRCYQYRWSVTDMAGNTANYVSEEIKVLAVIIPDLTVTPPDVNAAAAQDIYVTATVTLGSVSRIAYLWDGELNASCSNGYTIVSGVNLKETQPDGSHVLNVCAISDTNGVATYSDTYGYTAAPIIPTLQYQNTAANLYWNGVALNPLSENLTITGAYAKTGQVYHYRLTLAIQDNGETVTTKVVNVTTSMTNEVLFQFVIPISELNPGKDNSSLMGPQKVTITDLDTDESITFDYNVSFYFPIYQLDYEANAGNYIMIIGAGAANNVPTLQNFSGADCAAWPTVTGDDYSNAYGKKSDNLYLSAYYLRDTRDGKLYEVRKFSDGNCWMVDNLAYGGGTDGGSDYCVAKTTMRAAISAEETAATITNGLNAITGTPTLVGDCRNNPSNGDYGYLYNWAAAIQKINGYDGLNYAPPQPVTGLCPTGWILPTGGITGDFPTLANAVTSDEFFLPGGSFKGIYAGMTDTGENIGNLVYQGTRQNYWSSTNSTTSDAYLLHIQSTVTKVQESLVANKQAGRAIRCVKKAN